MFAQNSISRPFVWFARLARVLALLRAVKSRPQTQVEMPHQTPQNDSPLDLDVPAALPAQPEAWFVKMVESALRKLGDAATLGDLPLAKYLAPKAETQLERGRQVQKLLHAALEALRPSAIRPAIPTREWHNYLVLHDAYVEGIRNRDVMARLYISEGTFNRLRRKAIYSVALWLIETARRK